MLEVFHSFGQVTHWLIAGRILFFVIPVLGLGCLSYIVVKRLAPLLRGERDFPF